MKQYIRELWGPANLKDTGLGSAIIFILVYICL